MNTNLKPYYESLDHIIYACQGLKIDLDNFDILTEEQQQLTLDTIRYVTNKYATND